MSAMVVEKRETTNQWLQEKNDLQGRLFQLQALNTQLQGTLKKKEKDYDKLQAQLSKLVKDSNRGNKQSMTLTFTLPSSHTNNATSSSKATGTTNSNNTNPIHNQEIQGWKNTVLFYQQTQSDASSKKQHAEESLQLLKQQFADKEEKYQFIIASTTAQAEEAIQQAKEEAAESIAQSLATYAATSTTTTTTTTTTIAPVEVVAEDILNSMEAPSTPMATTTTTSTTATKAAALLKTPSASLSSNTMTSMTTTTTMKTPMISKTPAKTPAKTPMLAKTPVATGTISKKYLLGTPGAEQTISWIVQEVNTEMKKLRSRAEAIPITARGVSTTTTTTTTTTTNTMATTALNNSHPISFQEEILYLKSQLVEALAVIREQDKLIHDGKYRNCFSVVTNSLT
jgi:hypothetical protein